MDPNRFCEHCGQPLPEQAAAGPCLRCLAALAFAPDEMPPAGDDSDALDRLPNPQPSTLRHFGDYELIEEVARGGMGVVFKARQRSLGRIVALKMLLSGPFAHKASIERFRIEARAAANLQHPNIVAIHEIAEHDGQLYFSMDYVEGGHLGQLAHGELLSARRAAALLQTIAQAVHFAHEHGVLHRDLKPSNILIDANDQPRITDFGLAKQFGATTTSRHAKPGDQLERPSGDPGMDLTLSGQTLGTPHYMSPEQARGRRGDVTAATDVYALGAILFELLTGRPPFVADSFEGVLLQLQHDDPVAPRVLKPSVPVDLETICLKCIEKDASRRYATAQGLADDLGRFLHDEPILARPVGGVEQVWRWCRRRPLVAGLVLALQLTLVTGLGGILWQWRMAKQHAAREAVQRVRAEAAVTSLELQRAEHLLSEGDVVMGVAYLARMVRELPTNHVAVRRLLSALTQRNVVLPIGPPLTHAKKVNHAEFSPDGQQVVTASLDTTARVWDARTGMPTTPPLRHPQAVRQAHFSPDGTRLVTVADDFRARLWDTAAGREVGRPMSHSRKISRAQFTPDGRRVLTASHDRTARFWDAQTGEAVLEPMTHQGAVRWAAISPDGQRLATASVDATAQIWDAQTGRPAGPPLRHTVGLEYVGFSPDGRRVVTSDRSRWTWLWDVAAGELIGGTAHDAPIASASFSPDGQRILVALHDGATRIFSARNWVPLAGPMRHRSWTVAAEFGPEGQRVLTGALDHTARLWDATDGRAISAPMQHHGMVWWADLAPDGLSAVTASADSTARLWDVRPGQMHCQRLAHTAPVRTAEFSPDGEWIVTGSDGSNALIWNVRTGLPLQRPLQHTDSTWLARFSPDGAVVATGSHDGSARMWDARTGLPITAPLRHPGGVRVVEFNPNGQWLATGCDDGIVKLWNVRTGEPKGEPIRLRGSRVTCLRFSPDSERLLSADYRDDMVEMRDVATGRLLARSPEREGAVFHADFSPDGQSVVTASHDGQVWIWNAETLRPRLGPLRHLDTVHWTRFSADGRRILSASEDSTAQVWDALTGEPIGEPMRHQDAVVGAEFSPDGRLVLTASRDGTARLWDPATGRPVAEPFAHAGRVYRACFSADGHRALTAAHAGGAWLWDVPPAPPDVVPSSSFAKPGAALARPVAATKTNAASPAASAGSGTSLQRGGGRSGDPARLLADLAEAVLGKRVNAQGALENVPAGRLAEVRREIDALAPDSDFVRWLVWFCADRSIRTISPCSDMGLPEYVAARARETNEVAWREALLLCPTNGMAYAHMALHLLGQDPSLDSPELAQADWAGRQAIRFAPMRGRPWQSRIGVMERTGDWPQLLAEAEQAVASQPANVRAWDTKARALLELGQNEAALAASDAALDLWNRDAWHHTNLPMHQSILQQRTSALRRLGRLGAADNNPSVPNVTLPAP